MEHRGRWHWIRVAAMTAAQAGVLLLLAWLLDDFQLSNISWSVIAVIVISFVIGFTWPWAYRLAGRFHPIIFPLVMVLTVGFVVESTASVLPGVRLASLWAAILIPIALTATSTMLGGFLAINDERQYERFVTRQIQRSYRRVPRTDVPGVAFVEFDGLAEPVLRQAIAEGRMPTVARWLASGSHRLIAWEPDLSSQTSASQAGILLGDNSDIPAFRWYDKELGRLVVSSKFRDAAQIEARLSTNSGLLADGGASRLNMMSGDAPDCLFTFSTFRSAVRDRSSRDYYAYFSNPYSLARVVTLFVTDVLLELWANLRSRFRGGPRVRRGGTYPFVRAATTSFMQELSIYMVVRDVLRGMPSVYTTLFSYDEVAHHSGIRAPDALAVLTRIDHHLRYLERAISLAPRPYHLILLSDHGQSEGATFARRYGKTLRSVVEELAGDVTVAGTRQTDEHAGALALVLNEAMAHDARTAKLLRRLLNRRGEDPLAFGPQREDLRRVRDSPRHRQRLDLSPRSEPARVGDVVVLGSGNLGLISFTGWPTRMTFEEITDAFPSLLPGLARHPGIGVVVVNSEEHGAIAIGEAGIHYLDEGNFVGEDPLAPYGQNAAIHLRRASAFRNAPDILVNSAIDPATGDTAAFEDLLGNHGGLGGTQTQPFLLFPSTLPLPDEPLVGAASVHQLLVRWLKDVGAANASVTDDGRRERAG
jgi:uncharacterized membrane protein YvlD (DUF360 family)